PEYILIFGRYRLVTFRLFNFSGNFVKQTWCMPSGLILLGQRITFALHRYAVQQLRPWNPPQVIQRIDQPLYVMPVNRAEIAEIERLEEVAVLEQRPFDAFLDFLGHT